MAQVSELPINVTQVAAKVGIIQEIKNPSFWQRVVPPVGAGVVAEAPGIYDVGPVHGATAALAAERAGEALFSEAIAELDERTLLDVTSDAPSSTWSRTELGEGVDPVDLLVRCELASSRGEARRFLDQGGVYVNNVRIDATAPVSLTSALHDRYLILRRGRRSTHVVVVG